MRISQCLLTTVVIIGTVGATAKAQRLNTLFEFTFSSSSGVSPTILIAGSNGVYYGAALEGGANGNGVIFEMDPPAPGGSWTEKILYAFEAYPAAGFPSSLIWDKAGALGTAGALYGVTSSGDGEIFQLTPSDFGSWEYRAIHAPPNGSFDSGLVIGPDNALYGGEGGEDETNQVFTLTPSGDSWNFSTVYSLGSSSDYDLAPTVLVFDSAGNLFGNSQGGTLGFGMTFELTPPEAGGGTWTFNVLHNFNDVNGGYPRALVIDGDTLLGTTYTGLSQTLGGVVWKLLPTVHGSYDYRIIFRFAGLGRGSFPALGSLAARGGAIFGYTGDNFDGSFGTLYELTQSGGRVTETVLQSFGGIGEGSAPSGTPLFASDGSIFGVTNGGGIDDGGTFFQFVLRGDAR